MYLHSVALLPLVFTQNRSCEAFPVVVLLGDINEASILKLETLLLRIVRAGVLVAPVLLMVSDPLVLSQERLDDCMSPLALLQNASCPEVNPVRDVPVI